MNVAVDGGALAHPETGIGRYTGELLRALADLEASGAALRLQVFFNSWRAPRPPAAYDDPRFRLVNPRLPSRALRAAWDRFSLLPAERFCGRLDVFHASDWIHPPLRSAALVATVHDLGPLDHPEWYAPEVVAVHERINRSVAKRAALILTVSEFTRRRFVERFGVSEDRVHVTHNGVSNDFAAPAGHEALRAPEALGIRRPFVLYVGSRERRKNVLGLVDVFARVAGEEPDLDLVLVGMRPDREALRVQGVQAWEGPELERRIEAVGLAGRVHTPGQVSREHLRGLYARAEVLAFPTLYEGFGIPVVEAMACGAPVVASNLSSLPEVVGDAGLLADPWDPDAFGGALLRVLRDAGLRDALRARGLERARTFTWGRTARETLRGYEAALAR